MIADLVKKFTNFPTDQPTGVRTGWKRVAFVTLGLILVGLGAVGAVLPILPTTPFLIGASFCFIRSSPRLYRWLHRSRLFGPVIRDWEAHHGIRRPVKVFAIGLVVLVVAANLLFAGLPVWGMVGLGCLAAVGIGVILWVPTVRPE